MNKLVGKKTPQNDNKHQRMSSCRTPPGLLISDTYFFRNLDQAIVLKVSQFNIKFVNFSTKIGFLLFACKILNVVANTAAGMFLDIQNIIKE